MKIQQEQQLIFHIGLHKTGTTFLQQEIFPKLEEIEVIRAWDSHRRILKSANDKILISDEGISGDPFGGDYIEEFYRNLKIIKSLYRTSGIIIGIRKHSSFVLSLYKQFLQQKGSRDFEYLFSFEKNSLLNKEDLLFEERIEYLNKLFDNVFIYSQESLKERPEDFYQALIKFLNIDDFTELGELDLNEKNVGVKSKLQVNLLKRLNKLHRSGLVNLYSSRLSRLKLTPRQICQDRLGNLSSEAFRLPIEFEKEIELTFKNDWEYALQQISY